MTRHLTKLSLLGLLGLTTACTGTVVPDEPVVEDPTCDDAERNGDETDVDCGGSCEATCDVGEGCLTGADCTDGVCGGGACLAASCDDGVLNGTETDIDCGGDACGACDAGATCEAPADCLSGVCDGGVCQDATCNDGVLNGFETDLDCGGPECGTCSRGDSCEGDSDCGGSVCFDGTCERVLYVRGTATTEDGAVEVFAEQNLIRVDFRSQPRVTNYDGTRLDLPVSDGTFVSGGISDILGDAEVTIADVDLPGLNGGMYFQSIAPTYYGVVIRTQDAAAAEASYNALVVERLEGKDVEIRVVDRSR